MAELAIALRRRISQITAFNPGDERLPLLKKQLKAAEKEAEPEVEEAPKPKAKKGT